ncbi:MAG: CopG family transcriptional regulator [Sulfurimonas sp. RIFOXYD12_FULL_33_39]|uniref:ribbon-helix-helix protein, CopG family n=1 Tax=unclassified Sulfurimonas TaxID=2623549 RepID=UPI0008CDF289|nr:MULTISPECIES: ribbon-helix-helix protein, CopG family [unclassified Sulfurimonas]OHE10907.1 MAG: CopG family transcriptional regulator [Sulfurimonas sp. RIFOXYD12_FULL_33_39]OHE13323.1 MAG: CopG family transcriptional regulator [Sulfurimonas sp. RIFOXYD2_FULL_34_21]
MTATVRLDESLEKKLEFLSKSLHKKKSDVIREAISFYAKSFENSQKKRMLSAVEKTLKADSKEAKLLDGTLNDGL